MESYSVFSFVFGLLYLACFQGSPMLKHVSEFYSFIRWNNILLYEYVEICLSIHLLIGFGLFLPSAIVAIFLFLLGNHNYHFSPPYSLFEFSTFLFLVLLIQKIFWKSALQRIMKDIFPGIARKQGHP